MANPYFLNWQEVVEQLLSFLPPSWRANLSGKVLKRLLVAFALAAEQLYALLAQLLRLSIVATSEGPWLRSLVSAFNMETYAGTHSTVNVVFARYQPAETTVTIPRGSQVGSLHGQVFETEINTTLIAGAVSVLVPCRCTIAGVAGQIDSRDIVSMVVNIPGIDEVYNPQPSNGGYDAESDIEIKQRLPKHIEALHRATIPATEYAIAIDREKFPEVQKFLTQRNFGYPGYFRGILCDWTGSDLYRAINWTAAGLGVYWCHCELDEINGLVAADWICKRFGVVTRTASGEEIWLASESVAQVEQGNWRFCLDSRVKRIYAKADGRDLNDLHITIYGGVFWRALRELEQNWAANGVFLDIISPFVESTTVSISYFLEAGFSQSVVEQGLRNAVFEYVNSLLIQDQFELEGLYASLSNVLGATGVLVISPNGNVSVAVDHIFRVKGTPIITRRIT